MEKHNQQYSLPIIIVYSFLFLICLAPVDALWCSSNSKILRGRCIFNRDCQRACIEERFSLGRCQAEQMTTTCMCFKQCDGGGRGGGGGNQDLVVTATADYIPTVEDPSPSPSIEKKNRTGMIFEIVVGVGVVLFLAVLFFLARKRRLQTDDRELHGMDVKRYPFNYAEPRTATDGFSPTNMIGAGAFGTVYKVKLSDGGAIAVKKLSMAFHQGKSQSAADIATISAVQHRNLVKLYGCCYEGPQKILVDEYLENKSLDHEAETIEYLTREHLTKKIDVFASGGVGLEVASGRPNLDLSLEAEKMYLPNWAWHLYKKNRELELVDSTLSKFNEKEVKRLIRVALLCTHKLPSSRSLMSNVVAMLCGDIEENTVTSKLEYLTA